MSWWLIFNHSDEMPPAAILAIVATSVVIRQTACRRPRQKDVGPRIGFESMPLMNVYRGCLPSRYGSLLRQLQQHTIAHQSCAERFGSLRCNKLAWEQVAVAFVGGELFGGEWT